MGKEEDMVHGNTTSFQRLISEKSSRQIIHEYVFLPFDLKIMSNFENMKKVI